MSTNHLIQQPPTKSQPLSSQRIRFIVPQLQRNAERKENRELHRKAATHTSTQEIHRTDTILYMKVFNRRVFNLQFQSFYTLRCIQTFGKKINLI